jgi:hypothetical protein
MFFLNLMIHIEDNHAAKVFHDQYINVDLYENVQHYLLNLQEFLYRVSLNSIAFYVMDDQIDAIH